MTTNELEFARKYYRKQKKVDALAKKYIREHEGVIAGSKALMHYIPPQYRRDTGDYDVLTAHALEFARHAEKYLDKKMGGNYFIVQPAKSFKGVFSVKSRLTGETVMDVVTPETKVPITTSAGTKYAAIQYLKKHLEMILEDKTAQFRHLKARDDMRRLQLAMQHKKFGTPNKYITGHAQHETPSHVTNTKDIWGLV